MSDKEEYCADKKALPLVEPDTLVKWYCTERLVKSFRNLPTSVSSQVSRNLALIASQLASRGIQIHDIDYASRSCGYTFDGEFYVVEW